MVIPKNLPGRDGTSRTDGFRLDLVACVSGTTRLPWSKVMGSTGKNCALVASAPAPEDQVLLDAAVVGIAGVGVPITRALALRQPVPDRTHRHRSGLWRGLHLWGGLDRLFSLSDVWRASWRVLEPIQGHDLRDQHGRGE